MVDFGVSVLEEASKAELIDRDDSSAVVQYTTRHFVRANQTVRDRGFTSKRKPKWYVIADIANPVFFLAAGIFFGLLSMGWGWLFPGFLSVLLAGIALTITKMYDLTDRR